jgi:serine protease Do
MTERQPHVPAVGRKPLYRSTPGRTEASNSRGALLAGLLIFLTLGTAFSQPVLAVSENRQTPTVQAVERARHGTVNIHSEKRARQSDTLFSNSKDNKINGMGTGLVIDERGYIVTNHHVVKEVDSLRVTLADGSSYAARIISYDSKHDLAIIKIDSAQPLSVIPMGTSSDLLLGEDVLAIGNAFGYEHTVTRGIISALSRDVEVNEEQAYENLIQIDAAINPGNSGGPLLNRDGDVIGINVAIRAGAQKIGFAIPIDDARVTIAKLLNIERLDSNRHGLRGRDEKDGEERRLVVTSLQADSPASRCGLQTGDVITRAGSIDVVDMADFERAMLGRRSGESVSIEVDRNGTTQSLELALSSTAARQQVALTTSPSLPATGGDQQTVIRAQSEDRTWSVLGLRLVSLSSREQPAVSPRYRGGMKVIEVRSDSPAAASGIRVGDILVGLHVWETINRDNVDYVVAHPQLVSFNPLKFYILRGSETLYGFLQVSSN